MKLVRVCAPPARDRILQKTDGLGMNENTQTAFVASVTAADVD